MTGPEHYREAERLIAYANEVSQYDGELRPGHRFADVVAEAQVHATLALAASAKTRRGEARQGAMSGRRGSLRRTR